MEKKTISRSRRTKLKTDRQNFAILRRRIKKIGFYEKSPDWLIKTLIGNELTPPDSERIPETFDQLIYARKINGYTILFISSFNPTINKTLDRKVNGAFSKKGGSFWILIIDEDGKRVVTRQRFRTSTMKERIPMELECFAFGLKRRPVQKNGMGKMFLCDPSASRASSEIKKSFLDYKEKVLKKEKGNIFLKYQLIWLPINFSKQQYQFFDRGMKGDLLGSYLELIWQRAYYWSVERKRRKTKKTIKKIRKPWTRGDSSVTIEYHL
jgi:hypothetical protein